MNPSGTFRNRGFTLVELAITLMVMGILAALAMPQVSTVVASAQAALIAFDARSLKTVLAEHQNSSNGFPGSTDWGQGPGELGYDSLPGSFGRADTEFRLYSDSVSGQVALWVRYPVGSMTGSALQRYRREGSEAGSVSWTETMTTFRLLVDDAWSSGGGSGVSNGNSGNGNGNSGNGNGNSGNGNGNSGNGNGNGNGNSGNGNGNSGNGNGNSGKGKGDGQ